MRVRRRLRWWQREALIRPPTPKISRDSLPLPSQPCRGFAQPKNQTAAHVIFLRATSKGLPRQYNSYSYRRPLRCPICRRSTRDAVIEVTGEASPVRTYVRDVARPRPSASISSIVGTCAVSASVPSSRLRRPDSALYPAKGVKDPTGRGGRRPPVTRTGDTSAHR